MTLKCDNNAALSDRRLDSAALADQCPDNAALSDRCLDSAALADRRLDSAALSDRCLSETQKKSHCRLCVYGKQAQKKNKECEWFMRVCVCVCVLFEINIRMDNVKRSCGWGMTDVTIARLEDGWSVMWNCLQSHDRGDVFTHHKFTPT
jgi:hypothetical protein